MGLGDWACLQIETQDPSLSQGLPRWSCRQSMVYLMLLSPAFQEQYIGRICAYLNFPDISSCCQRWTLTSSWCYKVSCIEAAHFGASNWTGARPLINLAVWQSAMFEKRHVWFAHQRAVSRKPLAFVLFREALLSGCQIYHERFEGPIKALIIVLTLTRVVPHVRRRCTFSEKSRIAMAWPVNLYPCNPCTS